MTPTAAVEAPPTTDPLSLEDLAELSWDTDAIVQRLRLVASRLPLAVNGDLGPLGSLVDEARYWLDCLSAQLDKLVDRLPE